MPSSALRSIGAGEILAFALFRSGVRWFVFGEFDKPALSALHGEIHMPSARGQSSAG
jgi:hypothetical protein